MNYRDLILKLLKKRKEVVVVEEIMLADFSHSPDPADAFNKWCVQNYIIKTTTSGGRNIVLSKTPSSASFLHTSKDLQIQDD